MGQMMHRTQISLEKWQYQYLIEQARQTRTSISSVIRQMITKEIATSVPPRSDDDPLFSIIGMVQGDGQPVGRDHDRYLYGKS